MCGPSAQEAGSLRTPMSCCMSSCNEDCASVSSFAARIASTGTTRSKPWLKLLAPSRRENLVAYCVLRALYGTQTTRRSTDVLKFRPMERSCTVCVRGPGHGVPAGVPAELIVAFGAFGGGFVSTPPGPYSSLSASETGGPLAPRPPSRATPNQ